MTELRVALALVAVAMGAACSPSARDGERPVPEWVGPLRSVIAREEFESADDELARRATDPADEYFAACLRAELHVKRADYDAAAAELRRALEREPMDAPRAWRAWLRYELGYLSFQYVGTPQQALELYGAALALDPRHYKALQHRGHVHAGLGAWEQAAADWRRALECWADGVESAERERTAQALAGLLREHGSEREAATLEQAERERLARPAQRD